MAKLLGWGEIAEWYDEKQGDTGDLWHRSLIDPALIARIGTVAGLKLLDLGCGNGYLARRFASQGAAVTGVDSSREMIARARAREKKVPRGITYLIGEAAHLARLPTGGFDVVYSNMALMDMANAEGVLRQAERVLRDPGRFVASLSHPCFDTGSGSSWIIEHRSGRAVVGRWVQRYREPFNDASPWRGDGRRAPLEFATAAFHRPLSWYVRAFVKAGLGITGWDEPRPTAEFLATSPQGEWIDRIPLHCVIEARKLSCGAVVARRNRAREAGRA
jgi:SAM-dependent methyltransferase